jgi:hypothetical protein
MKLYRVARRGGHLGWSRRNTDIPSGRHCFARNEHVFHNAPDAFRHRQQPAPRDQRLTFANMRADGGIKRAVLAGVFAVAQGVAIAGWRTAPFRKLFYMG